MDKIDGLHINSCIDELKLLLVLISDEDHPARTEVLNPAFTSKLDWKLFTQLTYHHRVYSLVNQQITKYGLTYIPEAVVSELQASTNQNVFDMLFKAAEMERLSIKLQETGIRSIMLKGPLLAKSLYGDYSLRTSKDLDVLVPLEYVEQAEELFFSLGYEILGDKPRILNDWQWRDHHISYRHPQTRVMIELHWRLNPDTGSEPDFDELWNRSKQVSLSNKGVIHTLGDEDLFFYLVSHGARHGWFRLRWLADIDRLLRRGIEWNELKDTLSKYYGVFMTGQALLLCNRLFGTPLTETSRAITLDKQSHKLAEACFLYIREQVELCPEPSDRLMLKHYRKYTFALKSRSQKWKFLISRLYPRSYDAQMIPLPKQLHFLYFILRPFFLIWRRMKRPASS